MVGGGRTRSSQPCRVGARAASAPSASRVRARAASNSVRADGSCRGLDRARVGRGLGGALDLARRQREPVGECGDDVGVG